MDRRTTYTGICHVVDWRDWINPVDSTPCTYRADVESLHELKLVLHTSDGYLTFRIEFEKLGYHSKPNLKLVWWQQRGDFLCFPSALIVLRAANGNLERSQKHEREIPMTYALHHLKSTIFTCPALTSITTHFTKEPS